LLDFLNNFFFHKKNVFRLQSLKWDFLYWQECTRKLCGEKEIPWMKNKIFQTWLLFGNSHQQKSLWKKVKKNIYFFDFLGRTLCYLLTKLLFESGVGSSHLVLPFICCTEHRVRVSKTTNLVSSLWIRLSFIFHPFAHSSRFPQKACIFSSPFIFSYLLNRGAYTLQDEVVLANARKLLQEVLERCLYCSYLF